MNDDEPIIPSRDITLAAIALLLEFEREKPKKGNHEAMNHLARNLFRGPEYAMALAVMNLEGLRRCTLSDNPVATCILDIELVWRSVYGS